MATQMEQKKYFYGRGEETFYKDIMITLEDYLKSGVVASFLEIEKASGGIITRIYDADNLCISVEMELTADTDGIRTEEEWQEACFDKAQDAMAEIRKLDFVEEVEGI